MISVVDSKISYVMEGHKENRKETGEMKEVVQTIYGELEMLKSCGMTHTSVIMKKSKCDNSLQNFNICFV